MSSSEEIVDDRLEIDLLRLRLADTEKATAALRQMIDALASLPALEEFVPAALRIIASAFEIKDCAYYQHRKGEPIRLRYWFLDGRVYGPEDIRAFGDDHRFAKIKELESGVHVPDAYLGMPFRNRTKSMVLNHGWDDFEDQWEQLRKLLGWYMVLNVPLIIGGEADGALVMNRGRGTEYTQSEIELAERLGQQLALAMEIDRLAAAARDAAGAQARELATLAQIEELAESDRALQQTIDALAAMPDLENFIPAALRIAAQAFDAKDCQYYEHRRGELIRLRYWLYENQVLSPEDIANLEGEDFKLMRENAQGFTVPESYLGVPFRQRTKAIVVNHAEKFPRTPREEFCIAHGWELELNVPLVVAGEADGALVICRRSGFVYTPREISLAERLGQQMSLAMEASRLSASSKQIAVADAREQAARERSAELSRYAEMLKETIDSLVGEQDFLGFIGRLLRIASVQMQTPVVEYWIDDGPARASLRLTCRDGVIYEGSDDSDDVRSRGIELSSREIAVGLYKEQIVHRIVDMVEDVEFRTYCEGFGMPVRRWCTDRGVQKLMIVPLLRDERRYGALCVYLPASRVEDQPLLDLAFSIGQQISLAVRMTELAEQSKQTAVSRERETAANTRATELSKANDLIRSTLDQLSDECDLQSFPVTILRTAMEQVGARDGVIFVLDSSSNTLRPDAYLGSPNSPKTTMADFSKSFSADSAAVWAKALAARSPILCNVALDGYMLLPGAEEWHRKRGNQSVVIVPMFINTQPYGYFGMAMARSADQVSKVDLELLHALTQQACLAIQLTRLAEDSKQAALALEKERDAEERATEFEHANEVLRSTLDQLSKEKDLQSFPRTILNQAMTQAGGRDGLILLFDKQTDTLNPSEYINATGLPPSVEFSQPFQASSTPAWNALLSKRTPIVFDVALDGEKLLSGLADWHRRRGNRSIIAAALFIDSEPYGYFGITLSERASEVSKVKVGLIHALTQQATLAIQLTRLAERSQQTAIMVERQQLVVQERANMAREIHDKLAQGYAAILMQQHAIRDALVGVDGNIEVSQPVVKYLDTIERLSKENLAEARRTMDELRIDPFGVGELVPALERCLRHVTEEHQFNVSLRAAEDLPVVRRYVETELCRIVQEAVTNSRKHARSASARVVVSRHGAGLHIAIQDDGIGFDVRMVGSSFGISGMRERAARAGAGLEITSDVGRGTEVNITWMP